MRIEHQFSIAGFEVSVSFPDGWDADTLLPSFRPFYGKKEGQEKALLKCTVCTSVENKAAMPSGELIENTLSDMGYVSLYKEAEGYCVTLSAEQGGTLHVMQTDRRFSTVRVYLHEEDKRAGHALSSLLRIAYSQAVFTGMLYPFMLQRCIVRTRLFYLWERAEQEKARILRCG